ncbi:uncharacterized protein LOC123539091 isoform X2 [Mercenaria mercenaria]|nr:uncharacterized protein LOC123539091 isoform X2 [Mercenaria mercenaria]
MLFWSWILYRKRSGEHLSTFTILLSLFNLVWMILGTVWLFDTHHQHRDNYTIISTLQTVTVADWTLFTFYLCFVFLKFLREYCYCPCGILQEEIVKPLRSTEMLFIGGICMLAAVGRITFGILIICGLFDQLPFKDNGRYITAFVLVKGVTGVLFWSWLLHRYIHKKEEKHLSTFTLLLSIFNFIWMIIGTALVFDVSHLQREHFSVKSVLQVITIVDWALFGFYVCFVFMQTLRAIWKYRNTDH